MYKVKFGLVLLLIATAAVLLTACQAVQGQTQVSTTAASIASPTPTTSGTSQASPTPAVKYIGQFLISPGHATAGSTVTANGKGFEANTDLDLIWQGFTGTWKVANGSYNGRDFKENLQSVAKIKTDAYGNFQTTFTVPSGFGFEHDVRVQKGDVIQNKSNFDVDMQVSMSSSSGPIGSPITFNAQGIGWRSMENSWMVIYDNKFTGWMSSVTTNGTAQFSITAVGAPGKHIIQIIHGSATFPFINMQQSPRPDRPSWTFEFTINDGAAVLPAPGPEQNFPIQQGTGKTSPTGPALWTDISIGTVGTPVTAFGSGLPAGKQVDMMWFTEQGSRVSGNGYNEISVSLGKATVGNDGTIKLPFKAPDDLGGSHRIAVQSGGTSLAETTFTTTPSAFEISPSSGPVGTVMTIHLKGVSWTQTANNYYIVYDNAYEGYACGFNAQGDVTLHLPATGEVGWHYIDLYPGIYNGTDISGTDDYRIPQLTALQDHPGEHLPVFHFAFQITGGGH